MRRILPILRSVLAGCLWAAVILPVAMYVLVALPPVQARLCSLAEQVLAEQIPQVRVSIGDMTYAPFNRLTLRHIYICDSTTTDTIATVRRLGAGISVIDLVRHNRLAVSYAQVVGLDLRLRRDSAGAPLNIQPIIDAFRSQDHDRPSSKVNLKINAIVVRSSSVSYDVASEPAVTNRLDPNHVLITDIAADLRLPMVSDTCVRVDLRRLAMSEHSGLKLVALSGKGVWHPEMLTLSRLSVRLPGSVLRFERPIRVPLPLDIAELPLDVQLADNSRITPADLSALYPPLAHFTAPVQLQLNLSGTPDNPVVNDFSAVCEAPMLSLRLAGRASDLMPADGNNPASPGINLSHIELSTDGHAIAGLPGLMRQTASAAAQSGILASLGPVSLHGHGAAARDNISLDLTLDSKYVQSHIQGTAVTNGERTDLQGDLSVHSPDASLLLDAALPGAAFKVGSTDIDLTCNLSVQRGAVLPQGSASLDIRHLVLNGSQLKNITADISLDRSGDFQSRIAGNNPGMRVELTADGTLAPDNRQLSFTLQVPELDPELVGLKLPQAYDECMVSLDGYGMISMPLLANGSPADLLGNAMFEHIRWGRPGYMPLLEMNRVALESKPGRLRLTGDVADALLTGDFTVPSLKGEFSQIADAFTSILTGTGARISEPLPGLELAVSVKNTRPVENILSLPVKIRYPVTLRARIDGQADTLGVTLDAPYLWQGNREINDTRLNLSLGQLSAGMARGTLAFGSIMPSKRGPMRLNLKGEMRGAGLTADTVDGISTVTPPDLRLRAGWKIESDRDFSGDINLHLLALDTLFNARGIPQAWHLEVLPGRMTFNDTTWRVNRSTVDYMPGLLEVSGFRAGHGNQFVTIGGRLSAAQPQDSVVVRLSNVDLDYVFETLGIENAMFGGRATGTVVASGVMAGQPRVITDNLFVKGLKYNYSLMGDTHIRAALVPEGPAVSLSARVDQPNGHHSLINGSILATSEGYLDLRFDADRIGAGFMRPFMAAFASDVTGYASGQVHLFGTFKDVNMQGDVVAHDLGLTLDFTGTTVYAPCDSVHIVPGLIPLDGIRLTDGRGGTARLDGWLKHTNFHLPVFEFNISQANDMLVYNLPEDPERRWYGTIYGDGTATVTGQPGKVGINVDMSTAPGSTFTFIISDAEEAYDFDFITFNDRNPMPEPLADSARLPEAVVRMRRSIADGSEQDESPSVYDIGINVRVDPDARVTVVMDPAGGDAIRARGNGVLSLTYSSAGEELGLRGSYTLTEGTYNFTFQDIIRKDFKIREGSKISFTGDPYAAQLDLAAAYRLTANLSDLDESFLNDPELTRTTVPLDAMLYLSGDMRSPDINYDFEFPTLKDDVKRKVNSIVSTDDMKARQMLYLLTLSRFYTPEYVSATRGNELFSVASSTLSSQISNMLGSLAGGWTISPNIRSDRGDFSDVEVDLALSSSLLNNRLLFNGNFGYRDRSLNNNSFIGDFDIEYLLNRAGSLRLKAYNRYNDQNFYLRNALTTQGVGLMYRRDFDNLTPFWRSMRRLLHIPDSSSTKKSD